VHSRALRAILDASRQAVHDVMMGRRAHYPTADELASDGLRAAGLEPVPCLDNLTARPRPAGCACFLPEQHCPECDRAARECRQ
jgi:hypothetical protein